jgi:hypothetical protein
VPPFTRRDTHHVASAAERPTGAEYTRYLWLVEQLRAVDYDDGRVLPAIDFRVRDVSLRRAGGGRRGAGRSPTSSAALTTRPTSRRGRPFREGVASTDPTTGLARDYIRAAAWIGPLRSRASRRSSRAASQAARVPTRCSAATPGWATPRCATRCRPRRRPRAPTSGRAPTGAARCGRSSTCCWAGPVRATRHGAVGRAADGIARAAVRPDLRRVRAGHGRAVGQPRPGLDGGGHAEWLAGKRGADAPEPGADSAV